MFDVYLWTRLDNIVGLAFIMGFLFFIASVVLFALRVNGDLHDESKLPYSFAAISAFLGILTILAPTSKDYAYMYILPKIANQENIDIVGKEGKEMYDLVKKTLIKKLADSQDE